MTAYTKAFIAKVLRYYDTHSVRGTAEKFGVDPRTVQRWVTEAGRNHSNTYDDATKKAVLDHYQTCQSLEKTGDACGVSASTVRNWIMEVGIPIGKPGRGTYPNSTKTSVLQAVKKMSKAEASRQFNVPYRTIIRWCGGE